MAAPTFGGLRLMTGGDELRIEAAGLSAERDLGPLLGTVRPAVQPGRRIATLRPEAGVPVALALMTPQPRPAAAVGE
jgi:hypothetical protein